MMALQEIGVASEWLHIAKMRMLHIYDPNKHGKPKDFKEPNE
jgi:hypothetical protein